MDFEWSGLHTYILIYIFKIDTKEDVIGVLCNLICWIWQQKFCPKQMGNIIVFKFQQIIPKLVKQIHVYFNNCEFYHLHSIALSKFTLKSLFSLIQVDLVRIVLSQILNIIITVFNFYQLFFCILKQIINYILVKCYKYW